MWINYPFKAEEIKPTMWILDNNNTDMDQLSVLLCLIA